MTNLKPLFSSNKTEYITPKHLFDELNHKHHFLPDPCTREDNPLQTSHYYTKKEDGLKLDWNFGGAVYVNPPYGRRIIDKWIQKAIDQNEKFGITICMLLPVRSNTEWFHNYLYNKNNIKIRLLKKRLKFRDTKHSATFPSMVVTIYPEGTIPKMVVA